ncbi:hypothetical protein SKAU_G00056670 [Synaphobranchus kaupii]|uniref:Uncharacterized protein n=1 Tax=Synaphobranchus kaupii TaxID=118154 RepID=A0A9Q1G540_SYNKA|nr:hypothetical protein SKAU_G00056670 [Synaphobranchus kaupii]
MACGPLAPLEGTAAQTDPFRVTALRWGRSQFPRAFRRQRGRRKGEDCAWTCETVHRAWLTASVSIAIAAHGQAPRACLAAYDTEEYSLHLSSQELSRVLAKNHRVLVAVASSGADISLGERATAFSLCREYGRAAMAR